MDIATINDFYQQSSLRIPENINKELGHFNVFKIEEIFAAKSTGMPYSRRDYFKISLINGHNRAEYADKVIDIRNKALLFATPKIPYNYVPQDDNQSGYFCIFTESYLAKGKTGLNLDELPIYQPGGCPVFELTDEQFYEIQPIYEKMYKELSSDYAYKYDLIRNYLLEIIHIGQKLQPATVTYPTHNASARVSSLFVELLERQFPIDSPSHKLQLRSAGDYADQLAVHVNHLNKVLKENTGKTTTEIISARITQEAKILLKQTDWSISDIAYCLDFEQVAHFSTFFKKQTTMTPLAFRTDL